MKKALFLGFFLACKQSSPPTVDTPKICAAQVLGEPGAAVVEFEALKNGDTPTFGTIQGKGSLKGDKLTIAFNPQTIDTGVLLRDQRLAAILFKAPAFPEAILTASLLDDASGKKKISGQLAMAGQSIHFEGYGEVINRDGAMILKSTAETATLNLGLSSEIVANLFEMMTVAGVKDISKVIKLTGEIQLARDCG